MCSQVWRFRRHTYSPNQIVNKLRSDFPLWVLATTFMLICALGYIGLRIMLGKSSDQRLAGHHDVVKMAPRAANLTITLP